MSQIHLTLALLVLCLLCSTTAFRVPSLALARRGSSGAVAIPGASYSQSSTARDAFPSFNMPSFNIAALDVDTLGAIGNVKELNEKMEGVIDTSNPAVDILTKVVSSPAIIAVPIAAGLLVAVG
ncbi:hypothetical protein B484DRAFT_460214, partial [Ochromonadaceae sp. CCMP2298]